jgi:hypothetical protein
MRGSAAALKSGRPPVTPGLRNSPRCRRPFTIGGSPSNRTPRPWSNEIWN